MLSTIASSQPQAAFAAFTHGLAGKWSYLSRVSQGLNQQLQPLEQAIRRDLFKAITGYTPSDAERDMLGLPARLGGLGMANPVTQAPSAYDAAVSVTEPLVQHILSGSPTSTADQVVAEQILQMAAVRRQKTSKLKELADTIQSRLPERTQRAMTAAREKGASSWLTALPLADYGFSFSKADFRDAVHLRYGWHPPRLPSQCVCGKDFSVDHSLSCSHGGYLSIRHNEVRDVIGDLLDETCVNVRREPVLQSLEGEQLHRSANTAPDARLDICANGFWSDDRHRKAFFDVRIFHPHAQSYRRQAIDKVYRSHEREKRRNYEERVLQVEQGTFTPLVFSSTGGAGPAASAFLKRLSSLLAAKKDTDYSTTMGWLRCRLSFALIRCCILCLRGSRSKKHLSEEQVIQPDLAISEGQVSLSN